MVDSVSSATAAAMAEVHLSLSSNSTDLTIDIDMLANLDARDSEACGLLFDSVVSGSSQGEIAEDMFIASTDPTMDEEMSNSSWNSLYLSMSELGFEHDSGAPRRVGIESSGCPPAARRCRSSASPGRLHKRISVKEDVDFDPTPSLKNVAHREHNDISMFSFNTAQTFHTDPYNLPSKSFITMKPEEQAKYHSALTSLARSMKQTEQSRRQVIMQRSLLTPAQRAALEEARSRAIQTEALIPIQIPASGTRELSPTRSSIVDAFFAGRRGTLTNGLEQSRRQLRNYMSQVQNQTI